jgi:carboxylesterase
MYTLYGSPSTAGTAIHWMLLELNVPFEARLLDFDKAEHKTPEYLALNPDGVVPTLIIDGVPVTQMAGIATLLAERHPDKVAGVCALSTTFRYDGWSIPAYTRLAFLLPLFRLLGIGRNSVFMEAPPYGIKDEALRARVVEQMNSGDSSAAGLPGNPWWSVIELRALSANVQTRLAQLRSPCLVIHAREDDISSVSNAHDIQRGAVNAHVDLVLLDNCYHMITIDRERRTVIAKLNEFIARIASSAAPARGANG